MGNPVSKKFTINFSFSSLSKEQLLTPSLSDNMEGSDPITGSVSNTVAEANKLNDIISVRKHNIFFMKYLLFRGRNDSDKNDTLGFFGSSGLKAILTE